MTATGVLLAIEGIDGTGKTTLQRALAGRLRARGFAVQEFREPSRAASGLRARQASARGPWTAGLAFTEDRRRQRPRLERALARPVVVLLDRSFYSTLAYQASALSPARRRTLERMQHEATRVPDRVILLELPMEVTLERMRQRGLARGPTEREVTLRRAARTYQRLARRLGWVVLDARRPPNELVDALDRRLTPWLRRRLSSRRA